MEYAKYPFKSMGISQNYNQGNHIPHWKNVTNYSDKPWDEAGKDTGQECFAPLNDFKIIQILGLNTSTTNTVILQSVNKLKLPYGVEDYLYLTLTHINESDLKCLKVGEVIKAGTINEHIKEGTDGYATGNHFHITANIGKYYGMKCNNNGKWVFCYDKSLIPEEAFYLDKNHTTVYRTNGSTFKEIPTSYKKGDCSEDITKIDDFLANQVKGNYYGDYTEACAKVFQMKNGLEQSGVIDSNTLNKMKEQGLNI